MTQYFWSLHPAKDYEFGRLYIRILCCEILVDAAGVPPYVAEEDAADADGSTAGAGGRTPLSNWSRGLWDTFIDDLRKIKRHLKRRDATAVLTGYPELDNIAKLMKDGSKEARQHREGVETIHAKNLRTLALAHRSIAPIRYILNMYEAHGDTKATKRAVRDASEAIQKVGYVALGYVCAFISSARTGN